MFQGFSQETVDFLWGIRFNNERTWFEAHKEEYENYLYRPMKELTKELYEGYSQKHKDLTLASRLCRIYRDARRLHGRGPYKDNLWLTVSEPADVWSCRATFWFELDPEDYNFGLGYWMAPALTIAKLRSRMDRDPKSMEKLVRQVSKYPEYALTGETFKRPKSAPSKLLEPWYNRKGGFSLMAVRPHDELLFSPELVPFILEEWEKLTPLYRYLTTLEGDPDPREPNCRRRKVRTAPFPPDGENFAPLPCSSSPHKS